MQTPIPETHPLRKLFDILTRRNFEVRLGYNDEKVLRYLADLLTDFTHADNVYKIKTARGKRVEEVAEMLLESDVLFHAPSVNQEREVHKHIGDYTLFMTGVFPEYVRNLSTSGFSIRSDALLDYVKTGKRSYWIVSQHRYGSYTETAPVFQKLSDEFELCAFGLNFVRSDLDRLRQPEFRQITRRLLD